MALLNENFSLEELREHIRSQLGGSVWRLEGMSADQSNNIDQCISIALHAYSRRCPLVRYTTLKTITTSKSYPLKTADKVPIYSVGRVDFVYPSLTVSPFMSSLVGVAPVMNLEGRDFNMFLTWRKTFQRITGITPQWHWEEETQLLRIHNPVHNALAGVMYYCPRSFEAVRLVHKDWLRRASLAHAKEALGRYRRKFGGALPGPGGLSLNLDADKLVEEAKEELKELNEELFKFQTKAVPIFD